MSSFRARRDLIAALIASAVFWPTCLFAQSQPSPTPPDQANRVSITYVPFGGPASLPSSKRWLSPEDQEVIPLYSRAIDCGTSN
jgi:hypothetical protein